MEPRSAYKSIVKGTATFGGVQLFNMLVSLVKGKLVAILLGPEGMGIASLLTAAVNTVQQLFSMGLNLSVVKEISKAHSEGNTEERAMIMLTTKRLLGLTAILGAVVTVLFSSRLSVWTFGNEDYRWHFVLLAVMVYFMTLSNGELSILQGTRSIKKLAYASVVGSLTGLLVGVPLYYFLGYGGIVPAMIALSLSTFIFYRFQRRRAVAPVRLRKTWRETFPLARRMLSLGIVMMVSSLLGTLSAYLLNAFIGHYGSLGDVGLFQAANSITNQYVGLVFTAISLDFMPRLSAVSSDRAEVCRLVNQQTEIVVLAVAPLAVLLILTAPLLVELLLTKEFLSLIPLIRVLGLGIFFKAITFPMGYISFAKGDKRTFFWLEGVGGNLLNLSLACLFYACWGIMGVGIAIASTYALFIVIYVLLTRRLYGFAHTARCRLLFFPLGALLLVAFAASFLPSPVWSFALMGLALAAVSVYSLYELDKRLCLFKRNKKNHT